MTRQLQRQLTKSPRHYTANRQQGAVQPVNRKTFPLKAIARRAPNDEGDPSTSPSSQRQYQRVNDQTTVRSEPCQALCLAEPRPTRTGVQFHWRWAYSYSYSVSLLYFGTFSVISKNRHVSPSNVLLVTRRNDLVYHQTQPGCLRYTRNTGFLDHGFVHVLRVFALLAFSFGDLSGDLAVNLRSDLNEGLLRMARDSSFLGYNAIDS